MRLYYTDIWGNLTMELQMNPFHGTYASLFHSQCGRAMFHSFWNTLVHAALVTVHVITRGMNLVKNPSDRGAYHDCYVF